MNSEHEQLTVLHALISLNPRVERSFVHICFRYAKYLGGHYGLKTKMHNGEELRSRLVAITTTPDEMRSLKSSLETRLLQIS